MGWLTGSLAGWSLQCTWISVSQELLPPFLEYNISLRGSSLSSAFLSLSWLQILESKTGHGNIEKPGESVPITCALPRTQ